jgi:hypothetical protein
MSSGLDPATNLAVVDKEDGVRRAADDPRAADDVTSGEIRPVEGIVGLQQSVLSQGDISSFSIVVGLECLE